MPIKEPHLLLDYLRTTSGDGSLQKQLTNWDSSVLSAPLQLTILSLTFWTVVDLMWLFATAVPHFSELLIHWSPTA